MNIVKVMNLDKTWRMETCTKYLENWRFWTQRQGRSNGWCWGHDWRIILQMMQTMDESYENLRMELPETHNLKYIITCFTGWRTHIWIGFFSCSAQNQFWCRELCNLTKTKICENLRLPLNSSQSDHLLGRSLTKSLLSPPIITPPWQIFSWSPLSHAHQKVQQLFLALLRQSVAFTFGPLIVSRSWTWEWKIGSPA